MLGCNADLEWEVMNPCNICNSVSVFFVLLPATSDAKMNCWCFLWSMMDQLHHQLRERPEAECACLVSSTFPFSASLSRFCRHHSHLASGTDCHCSKEIICFVGCFFGVCFRPHRTRIIFRLRQFFRINVVNTRWKENQDYLEPSGGHCRQQTWNKDDC